ncbi:hypothetical protein MKX01_018510 [Papaver californicum]|nr:hypothetical protein MKX01_018510 [Papaver californicum]
MFAKINLRCRDVFANSEPFGNVSVVLVGDIRQLPPVFDTPLYVQDKNNPVQLLGSVSYSLFDHCVRLEEVFCQSEDEESAFGDELFNTRDLSVLTHEEQNKFRYALRLFSTKSNASNYNHECLKGLGNPIARIISKNNCEAANGAKSNEAKGLQDVLLLSNGTRVMVVVVDIVYANEEKSPINMPIVVMVDFDKYTGPKFHKCDSNHTANNKLDINSGSHMPTDSVTIHFVLGHYSSQKPRIDS